MEHLRDQWRLAASGGPAIYIWEITYALNKDTLMGKNPDDPDNPDAKIESDYDKNRLWIEVEGYSELDSRATAEAIVMHQHGWEPTSATLIGTKPIPRLQTGASLEWTKEGRTEYWYEGPKSSGRIMYRHRWYWEVCKEPWINPWASGWAERKEDAQAKVEALVAS